MVRLVDYYILAPGMDNSDKDFPGIDSVGIELVGIGLADIGIPEIDFPDSLPNLGYCDMG
ncbi:MAG TPA: hypothetical protein VKH37_00960 [Ferruginibacter sp.]|nr:hypothetical protein [Ferruginibacter sp.]